MHDRDERGLVISILGDVIWCRRCACYSIGSSRTRRRVQGLAARCEGEKAGQQRASCLGRLRKGKHPVTNVYVTADDVDDDRQRATQENRLRGHGKQQGQLEAVVQQGVPEGSTEGAEGEVSVSALSELAGPQVRAGGGGSTQLQAQPQGLEGFEVAETVTQVAVEDASAGSHVEADGVASKQGENQGQVRRRLWRKTSDAKIKGKFVGVLGKRKRCEGPGQQEREQQDDGDLDRHGESAHSSDWHSCREDGHIEHRPARRRIRQKTSPSAAGFGSFDYTLDNG